MQQPAILIYNLSDAIGGLELISLSYFKALRDKGADVWFLCLENSPIHQRLTGYANRLVLSKQPGKKFSPYLFSLLRRTVREKKIDVVHAHNSRDIWLCALALQGQKSKLIYTSHNFIDRHFKKGLVHRLIYGRCDLVTVFTEVQKKAFAQTHPVPLQKIKVIPNGVPVSIIRESLTGREATRAALGWLPGNLVIGIVGRVLPGKGQWLLLQVAPEIFSNFPQARILLVGGDTQGNESAYQQELKESVQPFVADGRIVFSGFTDKVAESLAALDIFILPSRAENFGTVLLEAMAAGLPCAGTNAAGTPEILDGGKTGLLFEPENPDDLKEKLFRLLADESLRQQLGRAALQKVKRCYDLPLVIKRWEETYREVAAAS